MWAQLPQLPSSLVLPCKHTWIASPSIPAPLLLDDAFYFEPSSEVLWGFLVFHWPWGWGPLPALWPLALGCWPEPAGWKQRTLNPAWAWVRLRRTWEQLHGQAEPRGAELVTQLWSPRETIFLDSHSPWLREQKKSWHRNIRSWKCVHLYTQSPLTSLQWAPASLRPFISVLVCQPLAELMKINGKVQLQILPRLEDFTKLVEVTRTATATYIHSHWPMRISQEKVD